MRHLITIVALHLALAACSDAKPGPTLVPEPDAADTTQAPDALPPDTLAPNDVDGPETHAGTSDVSGIWLEDANGVDVGLLVRRGSDDATASRAIYDFVTVFDPGSGLFFEVTMTDAQVRYPPNTFFQSGACDIPIGIGVGTCTECRSAWGLGFAHAGKWYKVRGGTTAETRSPNGVLKGGLSATCVAHGTSSAKVFVVDPVELNAPPAAFAAPLRFVAR